MSHTKVPDPSTPMSRDGLLLNLNAAQKAAACSFADTLAILAGPGSGKTHTLTSRTAWLLQQGLQPCNIIVATFTVKAAREMKERIGKLIGNGMESKLILGTFHSIARRYLARYGHLINIRKDFGIADSADSLAIIKRIVKRHELTIDPKVARSRISARKARGDQNADHAGRKAPTKFVDIQEMDLCYEQYEEALERSNLLDYDDLLLRCVDLLRDHPSCVSNVEAVLIDEFQDTNLVQFDLMRLFGSQRKRITIVGDPDQSIYGFRAAETKNYKRMLHQYPDTVTIALEENYRSSGAILMTALSVIEQDSSRVAKSLMPTHTIGNRPVLRKLSSAHQEAEWIMAEIRRCLGLTGDMMDLNDFAILLRSASLSRLIEGALGKAGITYRMVGGLRFYDRVEVKTILDYLRVIEQPDNNDALARIINIPTRRISEATIKALLEEADQEKLTLWLLILGSVRGNRKTRAPVSKQAAQGLSSFVNIIFTARNKMIASSQQHMSIVELIHFIIKKISYDDWLESHFGDALKTRWANVQELITQAAEFQDLISSGYEDESLPKVDGIEQDDRSDPLSRFLANVALASEVKKDDVDGVITAQVTISTIHAAKGLEWPVVFIPAAYEGSLPHSRAEDSNEERRLLYVAMTRAKALLYMSYPLRNSQGEQTTISPFLAPSSLSPLLDEKGPSFRPTTIQSISEILGRTLPSADSILQQSACLETLEDDLDQPDVDGPDGDDDSRFNTLNGSSTNHVGVRAPKRQCLDSGCSPTVVEREPKANWTATNTTMDQASSFSSNAFTLKAGFVNVGAHLQSLAKEPSYAKTSGANMPPKQKASLRPKETVKRIEGQGTLLSFVGIPETRTLQLRASKITADDGQKSSNRILDEDLTGRRVFQSRASSPGSKSTSICPSLANHRLGAAEASHRRPHHINTEQHKRNDYNFLSSSPPKANRSIAEDETIIENHHANIKSEPQKLPSIRPATTMHGMSMSTSQGGNVTRKTLGVKRSMNGWSSRKGQTFIPPTLKRPS